MQKEIHADDQYRFPSEDLRNERAFQSEPLAGRVLYVGKQPLFQIRALWSVLFIATLLPAFAHGDMVEIGYLYVKSSCEPAPRSPARGLICQGSVTLYNETSTAEMYGVGFNVGGVTHEQMPISEVQIIGPLGGEDVEFQNGVDWYRAVPRATLLSVQAEFINFGFTPTFTVQDLGGPGVVPGNFNLVGGNAVEMESPQFEADFQGELGIFVDATPVTSTVPSAPEPGTLSLTLIAITLLFVARKSIFEVRRRSDTKSIEVRLDIRKSARCNDCDSVMASGRA